MISKYSNKNNSGYVLIQVIVFGVIAVYLLGALTRWAVTDIKSSRSASDRELAIQIAEAGIDYYRWHLAHSPQDFQDGTGQSGPYVHDFFDKNEDVIGKFILDITPPALGSSLVVIKSTGSTNANPDITRTLQVKLAKPSFAKYAVAADSDMRFGDGTEIFGPIHSNGGIRFDGLAHNIISSSQPAYDDQDHDDVNNEFGVHTHVNVPPITGIDETFRPNEAPPNEPQNRIDIFEAGRQFPLPEVDFADITSDIATMKADAQSASGFWRAGSGKMGYHIVLKTDNTFDLYQIKKLLSAPNNCKARSNQPGWGTWSINQETLLGNYQFPTNGIIFLEDNVWIDGQIDDARLTIVAAILPDDPSTRKSITINKDLLYTNYDGTDVIGLIAQNNINVGLYSENDLRIDAALMAQKGRVGRYYYSSNCGTEHIRSKITLWGMMATFLRYGFAYTNNTGYQIRNLNYDSILLYAPPPSFPLTSDHYVTLSWEEIN